MAKKKITKKVQDAITSVVGGKKGMSDAEQKKMAAEIRGGSEKLKNAIMSLSFRTKAPVDPELEPGISKAQMRAYQEQLMLLCIKLDNARTTCTLNTIKMDEDMTKLCANLQDAIIDGNDQTVHYIVKTLCYGIGKGHKALLPSEEDEAKEIIKQREERLETYINVCKTSMEMDAKRFSIEKNTKYLADLLEKRKAKMEETETFRKSHPLAFDEIQKMGGRLSKLSGDALILATKMKEVVHIHRTMEQIKKEVALSESQIGLLASSIDKLNIVLNSHNIALKEEINEYMKQMTQNELERYASEIAWVTDFDVTLDNFFNSMEAAFNTPDLKLFVTKALMEYEDMNEQIRKADEAYGRFLEEQKMKELETELENEEEELLTL